MEEWKYHLVWTNFLGRGSYANVYQATDDQNNQYAVKFADFQIDEENLLTEIDVMKRLHHINIIHAENFGFFHIQLKPYSQSLGGNVSNFFISPPKSQKPEDIYQVVPDNIDEYNLAIVMPLARTDLKTAIKKGMLSLSDKEKIIQDLFNGLAFIETAQLLHLDIKPENILLFEDDQKGLIAKYSDFGISQYIPKGDCSFLKTKIMKITEIYRPPEIEEKQINNYGFYSDIWSLGLVILFIFTGYDVIPYKFGDVSFSRKYIQEHFSDQQRLNTIISLLPPNTPRIYVDLIDKMLITNPQARYNDIRDIARMYQIPYQEMGTYTYLSNKREGQPIPFSPKMKKILFEIIQVLDAYPSFYTETFFDIMSLFYQYYNFLNINQLIGIDEIYLFAAAFMIIGKMFNPDISFYVFQNYFQPRLIESEFFSKNSIYLQELKSKGYSNKEIIRILYINIEKKFAMVLNGIFILPNYFSQARNDSDRIKAFQLVLDPLLFNLYDIKNWDKDVFLFQPPNPSFFYFPSYHQIVSSNGMI